MLWHKLDAQNTALEYCHLAGRDVGTCTPFYTMLHDTFSHLRCSHSRSYWRSRSSFFYKMLGITFTVHPSLLYFFRLNCPIVSFWSAKTCRPSTSSLLRISLAKDTEVPSRLPSSLPRLLQCRTKYLAVPASFIKPAECSYCLSGVAILFILQMMRGFPAQILRVQDLAIHLRLGDFRALDNRETNLFSSVMFLAYASSPA